MPLPRDATADQIVGLCAATADLLAFKAALRRIAPGDWPSARSSLDHALAGAVDAACDPASLAAQRDARGRLAVRRHKLQLLREEDGARRSDDLVERRRAERADAGGMDVGPQERSGANGPPAEAAPATDPSRGRCP